MWIRTESHRQITKKGGVAYSDWGLVSTVGHWDSRINGSRGCHLDFHRDHQKH
jgi:hypothetical protein